MSLAKLRAGHVARIRVNPKDCLSTLDLLDKLGISRQGMSFAQCVSLAFSSLMETARAQGLLEEPDTFQFLNRMAPYTGHQQHKKKLEITQAVGDLGEGLRPPVIASERSEAVRRITQPVDQSMPPPSDPEPSTADMKDRQRLTQLLQLSDMRALHPEEQVEYDNLYQKIYPNG